jgi:hypothetical protein
MAAIIKKNKGSFKAKTIHMGIGVHKLSWRISAVANCEVVHVAVGMSVLYSLKSAACGNCRGFATVSPHPYCGPSYLLGRYDRNWVDTDYVLKLFDRIVSAALRGFREFLKKVFSWADVLKRWLASWCMAPVDGQRQRPFVRRDSGRKQICGFERPPWSPTAPLPYPNNHRAGYQQPSFPAKMRRP